MGAFRIAFSASAAVTFKYALSQIPTNTNKDEYLHLANAAASTKIFLD